MVGRSFEKLASGRAQLLGVGEPPANELVRIGLFERVENRIGAEGANVGPDLSDLRGKTPEALLVDILDPSAAIDGRYLNYLVTLQNGKVATGLIAAETASSITLLRGEGQSDVILRQDIEPGGIVSTGQSLMPDGLEKQITLQEMADLLTFLRDWRKLEGR